MTQPAVIAHRLHDRIIGVPIFREFRWRRSHQSEEPLPPAERPAPRTGEPAPPIAEPPPRSGEPF